MIVPTRRSLLLGLAAAAIAGAASPAQAQAPVRPPAFSSIVVDVEPLRALGLGSFATLIRDAMSDEARRVFADRIGGPGPRLVVRVTGLSLRSYVGGGGGGGGSTTSGGGGSTDYLEGEALVVGARGEVLARYPQLLALPSSYGGAWYTPGNEQRRTEMLSRYFAQWLKRRVS
jgi:hypothetical protein